MKKPDSSITQHLINCLCYFLITNDSFLWKVRGVLSPSHFLRNEMIRDIIKMCYDCFDETGNAPKEHIFDELERISSGWEKEKKERYILYLNTLYDAEEHQFNEAYILLRVNDFVRFSEYDKGAVHFANLTKEGKYEEAREFMTKLLRVGVQEVELGYDWTNIEQIPPYLDPDKKLRKLVGFGLPILDRLYPRGICETDLICVGGPYKGKKSCYLHLLGLMGVEEGLKVLHITHENSKEETWARYDAMVCGLNINDEFQEILFRSRNNVTGVIEQEWTQEIGSIYSSPENVKESKKDLLRMSGGQLRIQEYPMGRCTMGELERFLWRLELDDFIPNIVINDYTEKMYVDPRRPRHEAIDDMYKESKAIATTRGLAWITASQVTSQFLDKNIKSQSAVGEARSKMGDVDLFIQLSQNETQREEDITMAYITANRHGANYIGCYFDSVIAVGEVVQNCWTIPRNT